VAAPPPHPAPPPDFHSLSLPLVSLDVDREWTRLYRCEHRTAIHFNRRPTYRFNAPDGEYGVLYVGNGIACAFIETFGDIRGPGGTIEIAEEDLQHRCVATLTWNRPLNVVDLTGPGLAQIGADVRVTVGDDYEQSRRWARALWSHAAAADGILYVARRDPSRQSLAVFDRTSATVREKRLGSLFDARHRAVLNELLERYTVALL
jgi:RES domain-containing protein